MCVFSISAADDSEADYDPIIISDDDFPTFKQEQEQEHL